MHYDVMVERIRIARQSSPEIARERANVGSLLLVECLDPLVKVALVYVYPYAPNEWVGFALNGNLQTAAN